MPVLKSYDSRGTTRIDEDTMAKPTDMKAFNAKVIADFRANHGQFTGPMAGRGVLILTTTGARSGKARTAVLGYFPPRHPPVRVPSGKGSPPPAPGSPPPPPPPPSPPPLA